MVGRFLSLADNLLTGSVPSALASRFSMEHSFDGSVRYVSVLAAQPPSLLPLNLQEWLSLGSVYGNQELSGWLLTVIGNGLPVSNSLSHAVAVAITVHRHWASKSIARWCGHDSSRRHSSCRRGRRCRDARCCGRAPATWCTVDESAALYAAGTNVGGRVRFNWARTVLSACSCRGYHEHQH